MRQLIRLLGRLLIISLLLSSAVLKIKTPSKFVDSFMKGYDNIQNQHPILKENMPDLKAV